MSNKIQNPNIKFEILALTFDIDLKLEILILKLPLLFYHIFDF